MAAAGSKLDFKLTIATPYLDLTGELWSAYCADLGENWPRYNGTALYIHNDTKDNKPCVYFVICYTYYNRMIQLINAM